MTAIPSKSSRASTTCVIPRQRKLRPLPMMIRVAGSGAESATEVSLSSEALVLGAGSDADVLIDSSTVSRRHAQLELVPEGVLVRDLDSLNGTYYLGQRIKEMIVAPGARIQLGAVQISIDVDPGVLETNAGPDSYGELVAASGSMRSLFSLLKRLEGSLVSVLIEGESGTGKELIARAIHDHSSVSSGPFVAINCGALARDLVRSELFGHRRGAFTGAAENRMGAFEAAHEGTLFLDELGELPLDVQPMLLRALEERVVTRLGENQERPVRVRVIAATNRDLVGRVSSGDFRQDLYYRLRVVQLAVPPLRERPADVRLLAGLFARRSGGAALPEEVSRQLQLHSWPGNVRELRHAVDSYLAIGALPLGQPQNPKHVELSLGALVDLSKSYAELKEQFNESFLGSYLTRLLAHTGGNVSAAARISGIERSYLNKLVKRFGTRD